MSLFGGGAANPYDDIVTKTTDENLTSENWELILNLCDKVDEEGEEGAHNVIAALLKRLAHRNPNVQLYALALAESLSKNCGTALHHEIASRAFVQGLERVVMDRNTHDKVRSRTLGLVAMWTADFANDETLGVMEDCYNNLKAKNYNLTPPAEPAPPAVDDEIRRKEEEELQRVLEMSMQDKGGRGWGAGSSAAAGSSSSALGGGSSSAAAGATSSAAAVGGSSSSSKPAAAAGGYTAPRYQSGYVPARTPSPQLPSPSRHQQGRQNSLPQPARQNSTPMPAAGAYSHHQQQQQQEHSPTSALPTNNSSTQATPYSYASSTPSNANTEGSAPTQLSTRVIALHTFEPTEPGELAFEKGDVIKVVDRGYKDWWRGQLKGRTGIFPVNYVQSLPEPTSAELAKEAEKEAAVFAQAVNVEKLLNMLRALDPAKDNLADNEEIQELYRSSMALRPKIVKLIDKYSQKRADLVSMNETFVRARTIFDRMMEESLARHTGVYDQSYRPPYGPSSTTSPRPDSRGPRGRAEYAPTPAPQSYSWNQAGYNAFPTPGAGYPEPQPYPAGAGAPTPAQGYPAQQGQAPAGYPAAGAAAGGYNAPQQGQPGYGVVPQGGYSGQQPNVPYGQQGPTPYPAQAQAQAQQQQQQQPQQVQQQPQAQYQQQPQAAQAQAQPQQAYQAQAQAQAQIHPQAQPAQVQPQPAQAQPQPQQQPVQAQPEQSPQPQAQVVQQQPQAAQQQPQAVQQQQPQAAQQQQPQAGPPYVFDPNATYADPNVQAWASYYAQGGTDRAGAVYFISIPGVTEAPASPVAGGFQGQQQQGQQQQAQQQQAQQQQAQQQQAQQQQAQQQQAQHHVQAQAGQEQEQVPLGTQSTESLHLQTQQALGYQQTQPSQAYQQPQHAQAGGSTGSLGAYPGGSPSAQHQQIQPQQQQLPQPGLGPSSSAGYGASVYSTPAATVAASTPSWVLPKKGPATAGSPTAGGAGPSAAHGGPGEQSGSSYFPLAGQFAGMSVADGRASNAQQHSPPLA